MVKHFLQKPEWSWNAQHTEKQFVHQWIAQEMDSQIPDVVIFGAPLSRSSISVSGASQYPEAFRKAWKGFATYNLDEEIDLTSLSVVDLGDVLMHVTDIPLNHRRIEETMKYATQEFKKSIICTIGGDHSITACTIRGVKEAIPSEKIGIIQFDTHLDVRDPAEIGPANGTPIRQLIDCGIVEGHHITNIGLHGFFNSVDLIRYAKQHKIQMITLKQVREKGIKKIVNEALTNLAQHVDRIYVTVDMDVLDIASAHGVPASTPGGMQPDELFAALLEIGQHSAVSHIDFVCLDPMRDTVSQATVKTGVYAFLTWLTGIQKARREGR